MSRKSDQLSRGIISQVLPVKQFHRYVVFHKKAKRNGALILADGGSIRVLKTLKSQGLVATVGTLAFQK